MADIELVIKIPKDEYNIAKYGQYGNINIDTVRKAIANGTLLPKGHGDLIDASQLLTVTDYMEDGTERCYVPYVHIKEAETIIEADRSEENG